MDQQTQDEPQAQPQFPQSTDQVSLDDLLVLIRKIRTLYKTTQSVVTPSPTVS
jgi:hypothetical protein